MRRAEQTAPPMEVAQEQHRKFMELITDLETRTPQTAGLGWKGWRLTYMGIPRKNDRWQDPYTISMGRNDNGNWRPVSDVELSAAAPVQFTAYERVFIKKLVDKFFADDHRAKDEVIADDVIIPG